MLMFLLLSAGLACLVALACLAFARRRSQAAAAELAIPATAPSICAPKPPATIRRARTVYVYVAGCDGLRALRDAHGPWCWWKVGVVGAEDGNPETAIADRLEALGRCAYGGLAVTADGFVVEEPGFREWRAQRLGGAVPRRISDEVTLLHHAIAVRLPVRLSFQMFEARLRGALEPVSLDVLLGRRRNGPGCRYSWRSDGVALATEIAALKPRCAADLESLLAVIVAIVRAG